MQVHSNFSSYHTASLKHSKFCNSNPPKYLRKPSDFQPQMNMFLASNLKPISPSRSLFSLILLSISALFVFSYYHAELHLFYPQTWNSNGTPINPSSLNLNSRTGKTPSSMGTNCSFTVKVLAFDRLESLSRCLRSLANAEYGADRVNLQVFIDHFADPGNGSRALDQKLEESHKILDFVDKFEWRYGEKMIHYRTRNVGLQAQWLEAWWPSSEDEFAFVVEDDLELSPLYYKYLRALIATYYYDSSNSNPSIYGASLQRPRFVAGKHGNKLQLDNGTRLFLYQMVGTWGQLLFPKPWKEFRLWYDIHKAKNIKPILQGMVTTGWYKKMGDRIWTPWFIKFLHSRGYYNIYTNLLQERALSVSHRDAGVNYGKTAGPDSNLLERSSTDINIWEMVSLEKLKWYDFCFREVLPDRIVKSFDNLGTVLGSMQKPKIVIIVCLFQTTEMATRNLLCHFERLNVRNYVLLGAESEFLLDLARRGHPVIDAVQLMNEMRSFKLKGFQASDSEFIREILVKAYVIKKSLESGYDTWLIDGNMLPIINPFSDTTHLPNDVSAASQMELLFVRSSPAILKIWVDNFIYNVATIANSLIKNGSLSRKQRNFGYFVTKSLEKQEAKINWIDDLKISVDISKDFVNQTAAGDEKKMIFWSSEMRSDLIQRKLEDLGLWSIDADLACDSVVCHHQS